MTYINLSTELYLPYNGTAIYEEVAKIATIDYHNLSYHARSSLKVAVP